MDGTILGQGSFVVPATIVPVTIAIPSNADFMYVYNYTRAGTVGGASAFGFEYYWQRGMVNPAAPFNSDVGMVKYYSNGSAIVNGDTLLSGGFTLFDPSTNVLGAAFNTTAASNATQPVVLTAATGIAVGDVVRVNNRAGGAAFSPYGIDAVVGAINPGVSVTLLFAGNALATAPGGAGTTGTIRKINVDPLFYPRHRFITNITQAANANVSTSVAHQYTVGQELRFNIPAVSGMVELNGNTQNNYLPARVVTVVDAYNFTINIDTTGFTPFTSPTNAQQPSSWPQVSPFGIDTASALVAGANIVPGIVNGVGQQINATNSGILADSTVNTGFLGMILGTGGLGDISGAAITGPAGSVEGDVVFWRAGKSSFGGL